MNDSVHENVTKLMAWKEDVADPAIERVDTLWDDRSFTRGALWVIGVLSGGTLTVLLASIGWLATHVHLQVLAR